MARYTALTRPVHNVHNGLHLFRNRRTVWQMWRDVFSGDYRLSMLTKVIMVIAVAYIIFPFDVVPDFIPVLGWIDDGLVLYLFLKRMVKETQRYNRYKAMGRKSSVRTINLP